MSRPGVLSLMCAAGVCVLVGGTGCQPTTTERLGLPPPDTIDGFDVERYLGDWYEIASFPQPFQEGCVGTEAHYREGDGDLIDVRNTCTVDGDPVEAFGAARPVDLAEGKLEVSFFGPIWGDYWILDLVESADPDAPYQQALVGAPSRDSLWILSRTPAIDDDTLARLRAVIDEQQYDFDRLSFTAQPDAP